MKHIVFLLGNYHPNYSAVGKCIGNIADVFSSKPKLYRVSVICWRSNIEQSDEDEHRGQHIIRITTPFHSQRLKIQSYLKKSCGIYKVIYFVKWMTWRITNFVRMLISSTSIDNELVEAYETALNNLQDKIDAVIPACSPFESIKAALCFCYGRGIPVYPILFDRFAISETLHRTRLNRMIKMSANRAEEEQMLVRSAHVFYLPTWSQYIKSHFPQFFFKGTVIEHPLILMHDFRHFNVDSSNQSVSIVYAGSLIRHYVDPEPILHLAAQPTLAESLHITFYAAGSAVKVVKKSRIPNVAFHDWIPKQELDYKILQSDICLNIAEIHGKQLSSKIFEYMSMGKPILHIYTAEDDVNLHYLKKYPLALCIKANSCDTMETAMLVVQWCKKMKGRKVTIDEVRQIFFNCTPEYVQSIIERKLEEYYE